ncbi:MAG: hypothetical protein R2784_10510 [Saprospiraceae bacterium]
MDNCSEIGDLNMTLSVNNGPFVPFVDRNCFHAIVGTFNIRIRIADILVMQILVQLLLSVIDNEPPVAVCPPNFSIYLKSGWILLPIESGNLNFIEMEVTTTVSLLMFQLTQIHWIVLM